MPPGERPTDQLNDATDLVETIYAKPLRTTRNLRFATISAGQNFMNRPSIELKFNDAGGVIGEGIADLAGRFLRGARKSPEEAVTG